MAFITADPATALVVFLLAALVIVIAGTALSAMADVIADRTGFGEAMVGAVLLGGATSLPGIVTSVTAALDGNASLSVANAIGGIAAQTVFLAAADLFWRRSNLEHAGASATHLTQAAILLVLLSVPAMAIVLPPVAFLGVHPATPLIVAIYIFGLHITNEARVRPMWMPARTADTRDDEPEERSEQGPSTPVLLAGFFLLLACVGVAGWCVAKTAVVLADAGGMSHSVMGLAFTATVTSLPELVTTIAAVRRGALQLAIGGIIGGNTFDVLFLVASDTAWRDGSILHAAGDEALFPLIWAILMTGILLLGLLRRERGGILRSGFESVALVVVFIGGLALKAVAGP